MNRRMNIKDAIEILSKHTVDMGKKSKQYAEEKRKLEKVMEQMCDTYCRVPYECMKVSADYEAWLDALDEACEACPLVKFERGVR